MASFQDRFKGKTTIMSKNGLESVINSCNQPIQKTTPIIEKNVQRTYEQYPQPKLQASQQPLQQLYQHNVISTYAPQKQQEQIYQLNTYQPQNYQPYENMQFLSQQQYFPQQSYAESKRSQSAKQKIEEGDLTRYKPYTLKEYEMMKKTANTRMGGLGPNMSGEEWQKEKEKQLKRLEFAEQVRQFNATNVPTSRPIKEPKPQELNARQQLTIYRQKAKEFAKQIPRPPQPKQQQPSNIKKNNNQDPFDDEIAKLEREHMRYLNQLDKIK